MGSLTTQCCELDSDGARNTLKTLWNPGMNLTNYATGLQLQCFCTHRHQNAQNKQPRNSLRTVGLPTLEKHPQNALGMKQNKETDATGPQLDQLSQIPNATPTRRLKTSNSKNGKSFPCILQLGFARVLTCGRLSVSVCLQVCLPVSVWVCVCVCA